MDKNNRKAHDPEEFLLGTTGEHQKPRLIVGVFFLWDCHEWFGLGFFCHEPCRQAGRLRE
jgi:hypothetical protein